MLPLLKDRSFLSGKGTETHVVRQLTIHGSARVGA